MPYRITNNMTVSQWSGRVSTKPYFSNETKDENSPNKLESHLKNEQSLRTHQLLGFIMLNNCGVLRVFSPGLELHYKP